MHEQRTICLIPIPFSDLSSTKRRPVLVISNNSYNSKSEDLLVMAVTSNITRKEYSVILNIDDMDKGNLLNKSLVRVDKIYSLKQSLIIKTFGTLKQKKFDEVITKLKDLTNS